MKMQFVLMGVFVGLAATAAPLRLNLLNAGPNTYSNVSVLGANETDIYFTHARGIANVKLKYLSPQLQQQFHYDPVVAAEVERKLAEDDARYQEQVALEVQRARGGWTRPPSTEENLQDPLSEASLLGRTAPALEVGKWLGKKPALEGKFVLLSFWATWSKPSQRSIPELNALQKKFEKDLVVVGLSAESEAEVRAMAQPKLQYESALDMGAKMARVFGVRSVPCVVLVDPKGMVRYVGHPAAITDKWLESITAAKHEE